MLIAERRFSGSHSYAQVPSKVRLPSASYVSVLLFGGNAKPPLVVSPPQFTLTVCQTGPLLLPMLISLWKYSPFRSAVLLVHRHAVRRQPGPDNGLVPVERNSATRRAPVGA